MGEVAGHLSAAAFLRGYRRALSITQTEMGALLGVSQGTVSRLERGLPVRRATIEEIPDRILRRSLTREFGK